MPADLTRLEPDFKAKLNRTLAACAARGIEMRPYETLRDPWTQARYWRQSRSREEVTAKIAELRRKQAGYLAGVLEAVGPQNGRNVTNAVPGLSWHQWGEACDCFWLVSGRAEWSTTRKVGGQNGYRVYAEEASRQGLDAGGLWARLKDWPHAQFRLAPSPLGAFTLAEIDARMKARWGVTPP